MQDNCPLCTAAIIEVREEQEKVTTPPQGGAGDEVQGARLVDEEVLEGGARICIIFVNHKPSPVEYLLELVKAFSDAIPEKVSILFFKEFECKIQKIRNYSPIRGNCTSYTPCVHTTYYIIMI